MNPSRLTRLSIALVWVAVPLATPGSAEEPCTANFEATGNFIMGEGKSSWQNYPDLNDTPWLVDNLVRIVAEGGWQITTTNRDSGVVIGTQPVTGQPVPLNLTVSPLTPSGLRLQALIKCPGGIKVTDKEAKKVFCRIFQKVGQLKPPTGQATGTAPSMSASGNVSGTEKALRNADVLALMKVGLDDALIASKIQQAKAVDFDLSTDGIVALKNAGASNAVLAAMMKRAATQSEARGASSGSSAPAEASQDQKPAPSADQAVGTERVVPFRTGESIPLGIVVDVITIDSVKVTGWPKPEAIRKAEGQPGDTTKLTLRFTYANRGKKDWNCQYRVAILDEKGEEIGLGEQEGSLDGGEKAETNSVSVKMRTLDFPSASRLRVRALARPN